MKLLLAAGLLLSLSKSVTSFAEPLPVSESSYFEGPYKVIRLDGGWVNLENTDKNFCGGQLRYYRSGLFDDLYNIEIQNSHCKTIRLGLESSQQDKGIVFLSQGIPIEEYSWEASRYLLRNFDKKNLFDRGSLASRNAVNAVLFVDQRADTQKPAFEKLRFVLESE